MDASTLLTIAAHEIMIAGPVAPVFDFLSNHEHYPQWFPGVIGVQSRDTLPVGIVGKTYDETLRMPTGRTRSIVIDVVESEAPHLFAMEAAFPPLHPRTEIRLSEPSPGMTQVHWTFFSRSQSVIGRFFIRHVAAKSIGRQSKAGLLKLKRLLESEGMPDGFASPASRTGDFGKTATGHNLSSQRT